MIRRIPEAPRLDADGHLALSRYPSRRCLRPRRETFAFYKQVGYTPEHVRMMLNYAAPWCEIPSGEDERHFPEYPEESLAEWHRRHGLSEGA